MKIPKTPALLLSFILAALGLSACQSAPPERKPHVHADGSVHFISENIDYNQQTVPGTLINGAWIDSTFERLIGKSDGGVLGTF